MAISFRRLKTIFKIIYVAASICSILLYFGVDLNGSVKKWNLQQSQIDWDKLPTSRPSSTRPPVLKLFRNTSLHLYFNLCESTTATLKHHPLFPNYPGRRRRRACLKLPANESVLSVDYASRQFGFLTPNVTGNYTFAVYSDDSSEFWLSTDEHPRNLKPVASVWEVDQVGWTAEYDIDKYESQKSKQIFLEEGKNYFFEHLFKQLEGLDHYGVLWKLPGAGRFEDIPCSVLSGYAPHEEYKSIHENAAHVHTKVTAQEARKEQEFIRHSGLPFLPDTAIEGALPWCEGNYSFIYPGSRDVEKFQGVFLEDLYEIQTEVFPQDETEKHVKEDCFDLNRFSIDIDCAGNRVLNEKKLMRATNTLMKALNKKLGRREYSLKKVFSAENHPFSGAGDRLLLDLELQDSKQQSFRFSEYVLMQRNNSIPLCFPRNYRWNNTATVNIITTARDKQGWVDHLINSIARVEKVTNDKNLHLILMDYGKGKYNAEKVIKRSGMKRATVIRMKGGFHKTKAIQRAAALVKDPNEIVFQLDLHLDLPIDLFDYVRKHSIPGKMAAVPILLRFDCQGTHIKPSGYWESMGYGLFGVVKKDWDLIGGMDVAQFNNSWGGEDWDLCDRTLRKGYEIERKRMEGLFHYYHAHTHLWDGAKKD